MSKRFLLALDFDGVLHPKQAGGSHFIPETCDLLADVLDEIGNVDIVIVSTWKEAYSLGKLKELMPARLSARVVGVAPSLDANLEAVRQKEILAFLGARTEYSQWVALDDDASLYRANCPNLVACNPARGFTVSEAPMLWSKLGAAQ